MFETDENSQVIAKYLDDRLQLLFPHTGWLQDIFGDTSRTRWRPHLQIGDAYFRNVAPINCLCA